MDTLIQTDQNDLAEFIDEMEAIQGCNKLPGRINADAENVEKGLAKLVLTLIELLRQLLEKQAIKRIDRLTDEEVERLGITFMRLEKKMNELTELFGLTKDDLNIDLGPLGNLL